MFPPVGKTAHRSSPGSELDETEAQSGIGKQDKQIVGGQERYNEYDGTKCLFN